MDLQRIYQKQLRDHYHNPCNYGEINDPDFHAEIISPTCGDSVTLSGNIHDGRITDVAFHGEGSILSQATASLLTEDVRGMSIENVRTLDEAYIQDLIGMELGPNRMQTAALPLHVLHKGIEEYVASRDRTTDNST